MNKCLSAIGVAVVIALAMPAGAAAQTISEEFVLQACDGADTEACTAFAAAYIAQAKSFAGSPVQKRQAIKSLIVKLALAANKGTQDAARMNRVANALNASIAHYLDQIGADAGDPDGQRRQVTGLVVDLVDVARTHSDNAPIGKLVAGAIGAIGAHDKAADFVNAVAVKAVAERLDPGEDGAAPVYPIEALDTAMVIDLPTSAN